MSVRLLATIALEGALRTTIIPAAARRTGIPINAEYATSSDIGTRLAGSGSFDVVIATLAALRAAPTERITRGSIAPIAEIAVGLAVRAGAPRPALTGPDGWTVALRSSLVAHSAAGASGIAFARLAEHLGGIRTLVVPTGPTALALLDGRADLAVQMTTELAAVDGVDVVGAFPPELIPPTRFGIALAASASVRSAGLYRFLVSDEVRAMTGPDRAG
jgi:molybdate transport system substrate-binding protein